MSTNELTKKLDELKRTLGNMQVDADTILCGKERELALLDIKTLQEKFIRGEKEMLESLLPEVNHI
jgi:hypothetical protein